MNYDIFKVGIVGGGTMGGGIAALIARQGIPVIVKEPTSELARKAHENIVQRFERWHERGKIDGHRLEQLKSFVETTANAQDFADVQLFIEAVPENLEWKHAAFREFDAILPEGVIMASNTSSLPIAELARVTKRADRVLGMHFFNPPTTMALIELVRAEGTSDETLRAVNDFAVGTLQKMTIKVADRPGFLVNCLLLPYLSEGVNALEEFCVSPEEIDAEAVKFGWPMGPFALLDVIGIDTALFVGEFLARSYGDRMKMGTLFSHMLKLGRGGEKAGAGFYSNDPKEEPMRDILSRLYPNRSGEMTAAKVFERMMAGMLNEAVLAVEESVASKEDIELGSKIGIGCPKDGPLHIIDEMGAAELLKTLQKLEKEVGPRFSPRPLLRTMAAQGETFFSSW